MPRPHHSRVQRGPEVGVAPVPREEFESCIKHIEIHACSECGAWIAQCRIHADGLYCPDCGVVA